LEKRSCFLTRPAWTTILQFYISCHCWDGRSTPSCLVFFLLRWGLAKFLLPRMAWNHDPPNLSLLCIFGWQVHNTTPSYCLRWVLTNFLPWFSKSQSPKYLVLQAWASGTQLSVFWYSTSENLPILKASLIMKDQTHGLVYVRQMFYHLLQPQP
jgi:hypothetical protein